MSDQTKKQAIGYMMQAALKSSLPSNRLIDLAWAAEREIPEESILDNTRTRQVLQEIMANLDFSEDLQEEVMQELYFSAFDLKTVEEAGDIHFAFTMLFPRLQGNSR
ncbi:hypothetical protein [Alkalicoccus luteus]|uniref:Uncharacterized protein n=1 Tax=Alkalicoccus luteus TaxID=1237094 RepID=A0A969TWD8_9BACI|nr:hypothetical protein [Alkalicoccus luteus]NJP38961.1 hypothetical protein [Alkalicoccus luteus]